MSGAASMDPAPRRPPPTDLIGEDEELIAGRHPVEEAFIARRKAIRLLVVPQRRQALEKLVLHATNLRIPIVEVEGGTLTSLAGFDGHQGIALVTDKRRSPASTTSSPARSSAGAALRARPRLARGSAELRLAPAHRRSCRASTASSTRPIARRRCRRPRSRPPPEPWSICSSCRSTTSPKRSTDLHVRGLRVVGTDADAPLTARQADLRGPVAIVVGSEGQGLGPAVRRRCDAVVRIPMRGHVELAQRRRRGLDPPVRGLEPARRRPAAAEPSRDEAARSGRAAGRAEAAAGRTRARADAGGRRRSRRRRRAARQPTPERGRRPSRDRAWHRRRPSRAAAAEPAAEAASSRRAGPEPAPASRRRRALLPGGRRRATPSGPHAGRDSRSAVPPSTRPAPSEPPSAAGRSPAAGGRA